MAAMAKYCFCSGSYLDLALPSKEATTLQTRARNR